jgi:hypothetical protein
MYVSICAYSHKVGLKGCSFTTTDVLLRLHVSFVDCNLVKTVNTKHLLRNNEKCVRKV